MLHGKGRPQPKVIKQTHIIKQSYKLTGINCIYNIKKKPLKYEHKNYENKINTYETGYINVVICSLKSNTQIHKLS